MIFLSSWYETVLTIWWNIWLIQDFQEVSERKNGILSRQELNKAEEFLRKVCQLYDFLRQEYNRSSKRARISFENWYVTNLMDNLFALLFQGFHVIYLHEKFLWKMG